MIKKLIPDYYYDTIEDIPFDKFYADGFRLILTDLDNTLVSYKVAEPISETFAWKDRMHSLGYEVIVVSNSKKDRVDRFSRKLGLPYVKHAMKPLLKGYKKAIKKVASRKYKKEEILVLGDQLMTDIFGSKRLGLTTVIVTAIDRKTEVWTTRFNRRLEKFFLKRIKRKMPKMYEEKLKAYVEVTHGTN
ncbi:MAG: YqeG family HAD IIIA-type phosphatase [Acholeplasmatales bacterium]|nr:YqeG family HAD IIIA-type phosphatase [Acholeplasmatales bacterium]